MIKLREQHIENKQKQEQNKIDSQLKNKIISPKTYNTSKFQIE